MLSRVESYLAHFDRLTDRIEPRFLPVESTKPNLKGITMLVYDGLPPCQGVGKVEVIAGQAG